MPCQGKRQQVWTVESTRGPRARRGGQQTCGLEGAGSPGQSWLGGGHTPETQKGVSGAAAGSPALCPGTPAPGRRERSGMAVSPPPLWLWPQLQRPPPAPGSLPWLHSPPSVPSGCVVAEALCCFWTLRTDSTVDLVTSHTPGMDTPGGCESPREASWPHPRCRGQSHSLVLCDSLALASEQARRPQPPPPSPRPLHPLESARLTAAIGKPCLEKLPEKTRRLSLPQAFEIASTLCKQPLKPLLVPGLSLNSLLFWFLESCRAGIAPLKKKSFL